MERINIMKKLFLIIFIFSLFTSCSTNKCITHKQSYNKRNKNNYGKIYSHKFRSVKKDYVIKNGIAH